MYPDWGKGKHQVFNMNKERTNIASHVKQIQKVKVYEEIAFQIKKLIEEGNLKPGDKLPPERTLSELFNVSRHSVREALRVLEKSRMLNSVPGSGTYVAMNERQATVDLIANYLIKKTDKLTEIFELRRIFEPQVAQIAAKKACKEDLQELIGLLNENKNFLRQKTIDPGDFLNSDKQLHQIIAKSTKNSILSNFIERIQDLISESRHESYQSENRMKVSAKGHIDIINAILERNEAKANEAMDKHLTEVEAEAIKTVVSSSYSEKDQDTQI